MGAGGFTLGLGGRFLARGGCFTSLVVFACAQKLQRQLFLICFTLLCGQADGNRVRERERERERTSFVGKW